jgi:GDP-mannose transporter
VYYTNFLSSLALLAVFPFCKGEHELLKSYVFTTPQVILLVMSCAVGVGMSHAGYLMRSNVSATAGVVVGVVCKIGSVLINLLIWDQHASPIQLCFLSLGLAGGSLFQQAPLRAKKQAATAAAATSSAAAASEGKASPQEQQQLQLGAAGSNGSKVLTKHKREARSSAPSMYDK